MRTATSYVISYFHCPKCGFKMSVPRKKRRLRENGHIKDLYCPNCDRVMKMQENAYITLYEKEVKANGKQ